MLPFFPVAFFLAASVGLTGPFSWAVGQQLFEGASTGATTTTFTVPKGCYSLGAVGVGRGGIGGGSNRGGGGGGALAWVNAISVTPGEVLTIQFTTLFSNDSYTQNATILKRADGTVLLAAGDGQRGSTSSSLGSGGAGGKVLVGSGGEGGFGGKGDMVSIEGGGGGAGGYAMDPARGWSGGDGGSEGDFGNPGLGGGAGGGSSGASGSDRQGGGGVGLNGQGADGQGGQGVNGVSAGGGSGGQGITGIAGGRYGGGASGATTTSSAGGIPALRLIWGAGRAFPSTLTADQTPVEPIPQQRLYETSTDFVVPDGVTSVCAVCIGIGQAATTVRAGAGGGLRYVNDIPVTPGETLSVQVTSTYTRLYRAATGATLVRAQAGGQATTASVGTGGNGGAGYDKVAGESRVGGGAGGYTGNGSGSQQNRKGGGGGSDPYGRLLGGGGAGDNNTADGQAYGGGGGASYDSTSGATTAGAGGFGCVRIIWGAGRAFPNINTEDVTLDPV